MKQFLYLDTDIVNSIIAQTSDGLIQSVTSEHEKELNKTNSNGKDLEGEGKTKGKLFKLGELETRLKGAMSQNESQSSSTTTNEILNKTLHDAAFDMAYGSIHVSKVSVGDQSDDEIGNYLEIVRVFNFIDLDYLERLLGKDGLIDMIKIKEEKNLRTRYAEMVSNTLNREQKRKEGAALQNALKEQINQKNKEYDEMADEIKVIRKIIPYNRMLLSSDGYLIPLNEKYFRIDPTDLGFRYGGEITCVGMVTNLMGEATNPNEKKNIFAYMQFMINELLRNLLPTEQKNLCIIHPIAVYYEN